jgi:hypothetical protein
MGSFGGSITSALGDAGTSLANLPSEIYSQSGLGDIASGLQSLFGGGPDEAGYLQSLGQTVPQGVELLGPSETFTGPGFAGSLLPGFMGRDQQYANPSPGTQLGQGVGELVRMLDKIRQQSSGGMAAPVSLSPPQGGPTGVQILPGYMKAQAPSGGLVHNLIGAFTYGILSGQIPSQGQV